MTRCQEFVDQARGLAMHEMSIADSILEIIDETARTNGYSKVKTVFLEIGQLAGIEVSSLRFCFDVVTRDSIAQSARLEIIEIPGQGWCLQCARSVTISECFEPCPACGGVQVQITGGDEMRVKELEVT